MAERFVHIEEVEGSNPSESTMKNKLLTAVLIILVLGFSLATVLLQTNFTFIHSSRSAEVVFLSRLTGMFIVGLLFCQIVLIEKYKKLNILFTATILILILIHPLLTVYFNKLIFGKLDVFYPFTDMCVLCPLKEQIITLGRLAFWFYIMAIGGVMLKAYPWFKENWQKVHALMYAVFIFAVAHMFLIDSDARTKPFIYIYVILVAIVLVRSVKEIRKLFRGLQLGN